jgi:hypothetical protein
VKAQSFRCNDPRLKRVVSRSYIFAMALAASLLILGLAPSSQASNPNIYISPSGGGSGSSCSDALAASWFNNPNNWGAGPSQIGPGTTVHLCAGTYAYAAGTTIGLSFQGGGSAGGVVTLQADGAVVITAPYWRTSGINTNGNSFITINGQNQMTIEASANGTLLANQIDGANGILAYGGSNVTIENLTVSNIYVHACKLPVSNCTDEIGHSTGDISGYGSNLLIQGCTVHDAKDGIGLNYAGGVVINNMTAQNNQIYNVDHGIEVGAGGSDSRVTNIILKNNDIHDFQSWDDAGVGNHHDGIHEFAYNPGDVVIGYQVNGNYIHGDFGYNMNAAIYQESENQTTGTLYFNNIIVDQSLVTHPGGCGEICFINTGAGVYNNVITAPTGHGTVGIIPYRDGNIIKNNIIFSIGEATGIGSGATIKGSTWDSNNYYNIGSGGWNQHSFSGWQTATGGEANSSNTNPNLDASYHPTSSSTAIIHHGCNLTTIMGVTALDTDKAGTVRPDATGCQSPGNSAAWDMGAYNYGSSVVAVQPPTNLVTIVQ